MTNIDAALIRRVADLARLELNNAEIADHVKSISEILAHVDQLKGANVEGIEPLIYGVDDELRLREDQVVEFGLDKNGTPRILSSAPEVIDNGYKVPQIIG